MSLFKKLFGTENGSKQPATAPPAPGEHDDDDMIRVFDAYGREMLISKKEWRDNVLLGNLESAKNDPDNLYGLIVGALEDGFAEDVVEYARHLQGIDPNKSRAATLLGVVFLELERLEEAEETFLAYIRRYGEEGYVLTNLAKVFSHRGDDAKAEETLWRAIELDPNQENAVSWWWSMAIERGGDDEGLKALQAISELSESWRARLWLARSALEGQRKGDALKLYEEAIQAAPRPVPAELLMQMSGDLGNHNQLVEALEQTGPHFDVTQHGLEVGNNLIKANLDLGRLDHARAIVDQLYSLKRPDYQETLAYWDSEIAKARIALENDSAGTAPSLSMLSIQGPVWLPAASRASSLFENKDDHAVVVCFLGASIESSGEDKAQLQLSDTRGRITRALPLFLSEQLYFRTTAATQVLQPWMVPGGFVLCGSPWTTEVAIEQATSSELKGDYVVVTHLVATSQPPSAEFRLLRCIDGALLSRGSVSLDLADLEPGFTEIVNTVMSSVCQHSQADPVHQPAAYQVPSGSFFNDYQLRLEQALAVRAATINDTRPDFLSGEREIISGNIRLCLSSPDNVTTRVLLCQTLQQMRTVNPQAVDEFRDQVLLLQRESPIAEVAQPLIHKMLTDVFES